jgi:hypothetical protein
MDQVAWRIRGRIQAYRYRVDMLRRHGDLVKLQEMLLVTGLGTIVGICMMALGALGR